MWRRPQDAQATTSAQARDAPRAKATSKGRGPRTSLLRPAPDDGLVRRAQEEPNGHDGEPLIVLVHGNPAPVLRKRRGLSTTSAPAAVSRNLRKRAKKAPTATATATAPLSPVAGRVDVSTLDIKHARNARPAQVNVENADLRGTSCAGRQGSGGVYS